MLNIYFHNEDNLPEAQTVHNVEEEFDKLRLNGTELDKKLIEVIEQGQYLDCYSYIDRWGYKLPIDDMSNGCKAALCVANNPDKIIDLIECGLNARDVIINYCTEGSIIISDYGIIIRQYVRTIDVHIDNYNITDIDKLNEYIYDERPSVPNMFSGGIVCLE